MSPLTRTGIAIELKEGCFSSLRQIKVLSLDGAPDQIFEALVGEIRMRGYERGLKFVIKIGRYLIWPRKE